jgi:hypothetical protein
LQPQQADAHFEVTNTTHNTWVDTNAVQHRHLYASLCDKHKEGLTVTATPLKTAAPPTLCYKAVDSEMDVFIALTDVEVAADAALRSIKRTSTASPTQSFSSAKRRKTDDASSSATSLLDDGDDEEYEPKTPAKVAKKVKHGVAYTNNKEILSYHSPEKLAFDPAEHAYVEDPFQRLRDISLDFSTINDNDFYALNRCILTYSPSYKVVAPLAYRVMHLSWVLAEAANEIRSRLSRGTSRPSIKPKVAASDKWAAIHMVDRLMNAGFLIIHRESY